MEHCPKCGNTLGQPNLAGPAICRHCISVQILRSPDAVAGSTNGDDYEIERELGRGGEGTVYLAMDRKVGRQVAIKLIRSYSGSDGVSERRFRAEVEAMASLDHPNIVPIYASGAMKGRLFFAMKYMKGGSLDGVMDQFTDLEQIVNLVIKLAHAIHHAHERGILHRDIKPSNILLDENLEPYLSDLGLAKQSEQNLNLTMTGVVMGTPAYMSPEQARGDHSQVTTTSDIFSLGSIFFRLLAQRNAFVADSSHATLKLVIEGEVRFPREGLAHLDQDLKAICLKCLEKNPEKRYSTALALAEDLERWKRREPVLARLITPAERTIRYIRRRPYFFAAIAVAIVSLVVGSVLSTILWRRAESALKSSDRARNQADQARDVAEENTYFSTVANALAARERFDFGRANRLLQSADSERRGFEWDLVNWLSQGDETWKTQLPALPTRHLIYDKAGSRYLLLTVDRRFHQIDPENGNLTLAGTFPDTPGGSAIDLRQSGILQFAFSPDGKHYSFVDGDQLLIVNVTTNSIVSQTTAFSDTWICWLGADRLLYTQSSQYVIPKNDEGVFTSSARIFHLGTKETVDLPRRAYVGPLSLSPDGSRIALVREHKLAEVFRLDQNFEGEPEVSFAGSHGTIRELAFSPDGQNLAIGRLSGVQRNVSLGHIASGDMTFEQERPSLTFVDFAKKSSDLILVGREPWLTTWRHQKPSPSQPTFDDGNLSGSIDGTDGPFTHPARLLTRSTLDQRTRFFFGHGGAVTASLSLPDSNTLFTASQDRTLRSWALDKPINHHSRQSDIETSYGFHHPTASHSGVYIAYRNGEGRAEVWHRPTNLRTTLSPGQNYLIVLNDGRVLTRIDQTGEVICWQLSPHESPRELWRLNPGPTNPRFPMHLHASVTPDERFAVILHPGRLLTIDIESRSAETTDDQAMVHGVTAGETASISPDGKLVAVTGFRGPHVRLYQRGNLSAGHEKLHSMSNQSSKDSASAFSHDGRRLYVGNDDGWVRVFDLATRQEISAEAWHAHTSAVTALAISQQGNIVGTTGGENTILWAEKKNPDQARRILLPMNTGMSSRNWVQFCGQDTLFLHSAPGRSLEVWEAK